LDFCKEYFRVKERLKRPQVAVVPTVSILTDQDHGKPNSVLTRTENYVLNTWEKYIKE